jgi:hypothetical protein
MAEVAAIKPAAASTDPIKVRVYFFMDRIFLNL